jgi:hypothetical protein
MLDDVPASDGDPNRAEVSDVAAFLGPTSGKRCWVHRRVFVDLDRPRGTGRHSVRTRTAEPGFARSALNAISTSRLCEYKFNEGGRGSSESSGRGRRFCPGPTFLCHLTGIDSQRRRSWVGLSACSPQVVWPMHQGAQPSASNFVVTEVAARGGGYGGDPLSPRRQPERASVAVASIGGLGGERSATREQAADLWSLRGAHSRSLSGGRPSFARVASRLFDVYARMLRPAS